MRKKLVLTTTFTLLIISISFPLYYVIETIATSLLLKNISEKIKISKPKVEYVAFSNLESVIKKQFNGNSYTIYTSARQTKGTAEITRGKEKNLLMQNTDIIDVYGSAQNNNTKDIYHFECEYLNISNSNNTLKLYKNFYIALEINKSKEVVEMRGDNITFNMLESSISSNEPTIFNARNMMLVAGKFFYKDNTISMQNDVFIDSENITISSKEATIKLSAKPGLIKDEKLAIEYAIFKGSVKMFDRKNNVSIVANSINLDKKKNVAFLEGGVVIKRPDGTVSGNKLTYNLSQDFTKIEGKKNEMVEIKVKF